MPNGKLIEYNDKIYYGNSPIALQQQIGDNYQTINFIKTETANITANRKQTWSNTKLFDIPYNLNNFLYFTFSASGTMNVHIESGDGSDPTYVSFLVNLYDNVKNEPICTISRAGGITISPHTYSTTWNTEDYVVCNYGIHSTNKYMMNIMYAPSSYNNMSVCQTLSNDISIYVYGYNSTKTTPTTFTGNLSVSMSAVQMIA